MQEVTFLSNKARKELYKYSSITLIAVITWIFQVSVFSNILIYNTHPNIMFITTLFFGLIGGPVVGTYFGTISAFLSSTILYDHVFYFSYPLLGFISGLLIKNLFADELLFFLVMIVAFAVPMELINGLQYSFRHPMNIYEKAFYLGAIGALINTILGLFLYFLLSYISKKLHLR